MVNTTVPAGFPGSTKTGVNAGTTLTNFNGTLVIDQDNTVIEGMHITGNIRIEANNVTFKNCLITSTTEWHAIYVIDGASGFRLEDSEIVGNGGTVNAVLGYGTFLRNNIHGFDNGINVTGPSLIKDNYIHDFSGGPDAHYDGIENNGSSDVTIRHNTIIVDRDQTSAVMLNNEFGSLHDILVENNYLLGGGYTVYLDGRKGGGAVDDNSILIINNYIGEGHWGPFSFYDDNPVHYGNLNTVGYAAIDSGGSSDDPDSVDSRPDPVVDSGTHTDGVTPVSYIPVTDGSNGMEGTLRLDTGVGENSGIAYRLYQAALDRAPDMPGLVYWINRIDAGDNLHDIANGFLSSHEFEVNYGEHLSNAQFLHQLYDNILHRAGEGDGLAFWNSQLNGGAFDRGQALIGFSESAENVTFVGNVIADGIFIS